MHTRNTAGNVSLTQGDAGVATFSQGIEALALSSSGDVEDTLLSQGDTESTLLSRGVAEGILVSQGDTSATPLFRGDGNREGGACAPSSVVQTFAPVVCERFDSLGLADKGRVYRLGIMGGTFDPIHMGHLACAEQVRETFSLDGVVFMPAGCPWMKRHRRVSKADDRFAMVYLAVADNPSFDVSRFEIDRPGETYTADTLRALRAHFPSNVELYFISGADAVFRILEWRNAEEVAHLARLIAVTRPGYEISDARRKYMRTHASILHLWQTEVTALAISSTDLREKVAAGKSIRYLVPQVVADYIRDKGLYR